MESVTNENEIENLENNKILGNPSISKSKINFIGIDNILYCENNVDLVGSTINFKGNNSLVYLSSTDSKYSLNIQVIHNSTVYFGKDNNIVPMININAQEHKNVIIGDDCSILSNVSIRTTDAHSFYNVDSKKRINYSGSVFIGDHVFLGHNAYIEKGAKIGSGTIIGNNAHVPSNVSLPSNKLFAGNPVKVFEDGVFFIKDYPASYNVEGTKDSSDYISNVFLFKNVAGESLDLNKIDSLLSNFSVSDKIEFIQRLFVQNKRHDRFSL